ncbi:MAG: type II toxin-antitoxin system RelE/ParE family toxin [Planctomycetes bacterium]|nr:type II toxin-antitoxin system RelE/ParE family toxin [Planctomycetota bacterium]
MNFPANFSPQAEADLDEAASWHERQSAGLGVELVREVRNTLIQVGSQPNAYPEMRPGVRRAQVRRFSYGIFYRVRADQIQVIGVFHDRRSPRVWQRRARGN